MAFQTGTASDIKDLLSDLNAFLLANGWTLDFSNTAGSIGWYAWSKNAIAVVCAFDTVGGADGPQMVMWANTSNDNSGSPWLSTGNDGQDPSNASGGNFWTNDRGIYNLTGPFTGYWFFENDNNPAYVHVVIEVNAGLFRHFGFGELEKIGDWPGGEYYYAQRITGGFSSDIPYNNATSILLSGTAIGNSLFKATIRAPQFAGELGAGEQWLIVGAPGTGPTNSGQDRAGNNRGAAYGGGVGTINGAFSWIRASQLAAFVPLLPMPVFYYDAQAVPDKAILMGTHPDVRKINMANFDPGEVLTVAGEDWYIFPWIRKQILQQNTEESWNGGFAYRRENA